VKPVPRAEWLFPFLAGYGLFVTLPFLAPVMMQAGLSPPGRAIYFVYSFLCHQLPERSLFLFGPRTMYSLSDIQVAWQTTQDPVLLRQFIGNPQMGWKVAWSDRMIALYGGIWAAGLLWATIRRYGPNQKIPTWAFLVLAMPMAVDGMTHFVSDLSGLKEGFRYANDWLAVLTNRSFPASFYTGDGLGSFNSDLRWITGLLFSFGLVWWAFPRLDRSPD
jgi:uncharacterized membrane protein